LRARPSTSVNCRDFFYHLKTSFKAILGVLQLLGDGSVPCLMSKRAQKATELLAVAAKLRGFERDTADLRYSNRFRLGAEQLEIEAVGCAASDTVAHALRTARTRLHNPYRTGALC
jgi:hypothetical protein